MCALLGGLGLLGFRYVGRRFRVGVVEEKYVGGLVEAASNVGDMRICFNVSRYCWVVGGV